MKWDRSASSIFCSPSSVTHSRASLEGKTTMRKYGLFQFLVDIILTLLTGGLWLIWIFVREMRRR